MTQEEEVLSIVKTRLGLLDETNDALINTYIREIGRRIKHFCNITSIPDDLIDTWASMVLDAVRVEMPNMDGVDGGSDAGLSIKIGDTSISPAKSSDSGGLVNTAKSIIDQVVLNYRVDLVHYRRLKW